MKYGLDESIARIESKKKAYLIRRKKRQIASLATAIVLLITASLVTMYRLTGFEPLANTASGYGALMLSDEAGGYILVGVISFVVAVVITLICIHFANRNRKDR